MVLAAAGVLVRATGVPNRRAESGKNGSRPSLIEPGISNVDRAITTGASAALAAGTAEVLVLVAGAAAPALVLAAAAAGWTKATQLRTVARFSVNRSEAVKFMRAYRKARAWVRTASPAAIAQKLQPLFPGTERAALERGLLACQTLGCWNGEPVIDPSHYEAALDVFEHSSLISKRHPYADMVVAAPDAR